MRFAGFSDRLHPMVVKELRQGMRSRGFIILHLALQGLLLLLVILYIFERLGMTPSGLADRFFRGLQAGLLLVAMPVMSFLYGIRSERKQGTYDLLICTHMRPVDIHRGKWLTRLVQSLLLLSAMLPYLVVRHLLGRVELAGDLLFLGVLLVYSALFTSLANRMFSVLSPQRSIGILLWVLLFSPYFIGLVSHPSELSIVGLVLLFFLWLATRIPRAVVTFVLTIVLFMWVPLFLHSLFSGFFHASLTQGVILAALIAYVSYLFKTLPEVKPYPRRIHDRDLARS